jgi:hypothetical protein
MTCLRLFRSNIPRKASTEQAGGGGAFLLPELSILRNKHIRSQRTLCAEVVSEKPIIQSNPQKQKNVSKRTDVSHLSVGF